MSIIVRNDVKVNGFKVGDLAVYPAHGVGRVEKIEKKEISGSMNTFYILKILDNGMTVMVPKETAHQVGMRTVIQRKKVTEVYSVLKSSKSGNGDYQTWNRRYREYSDKIRSGSVLEIAAVLRDLYILKHTKELSFGERKMLDTARALLVKELSIAEKRKEEEVEKGILTIFKRNGRGIIN
ncbi:MAG: CarD family transcriptional regulator [Deltaproteobacteria bacterium]|nr:CarD family transcriptional regulator [Deltaproteobacteria bacterium]